MTLSFILQTCDPLRCYGFHKTTSLYCEIREYCEGGTLADLMEDRKRSSRFGGKQMRQYQLRVGELLYQVCQALQYLHSHGYVYRNLRCSTVEFKDKSRTQIALAGLGHLARASDLDQPPLGVAVERGRLGAGGRKKPEGLPKPVRAVGDFAVGLIRLVFGWITAKICD